jgi:hypothetical protein
MNKRMIAGLGALLLAGACQKNDDIAPDPAKVTMTVISPLPGQIFRSGDTVRLKATVRYPGQLHGYELLLTDSASGTVVHDLAQHVHADSFDIDGQWISAASQPASIKLSLIADIDHDGDQARQDFSFTVLPR